MADASANIAFQVNVFQNNVFQTNPTQYSDKGFKAAGRITGSLFGVNDPGEFGYGDRGISSTGSKFGERDKAH